MAMLMQRWCATAKRLLPTAEQTYAFSSISTPAAPETILCGRGDKRTKKGKIFKGSFGNSRPKKDKKVQRIKDKLESVLRTARKPGLLKNVGCLQIYMDTEIRIFTCSYMGEPARLCKQQTSKGSGNRKPRIC